MINTDAQLNSLADVLQLRARNNPEKLAFRFLGDGDSETEALTYRETYQRAQVVASLLCNMGEFGDRVILLYPPGLDFVVGFFACLYAGFIPVPLPSPSFNKPSSRLEAVVKDCDPRLFLTTHGYHSKISSHANLFPYLTNICGLATDNLDWQEDVNLAARYHAIALLQYTSGSISTPKGVTVTQSNLLTNTEMIRTAFGWHENTVMISWLPAFHDMGLVGNTLTPIFVGFTCIQMPPAAFLQQPFRWLSAASRYRATCIGAPNFAYDLCTRRIAANQVNELDLSALEWAYSGSERVKAETLQRFTSKFTSAGFKEETFYPCYGLAEVTLFASGGSKDDKPIVLTLNRLDLEHNRVVPCTVDNPNARQFVGCGKALDSQCTIIVDPETHTRCSFQDVGEIWIAGDHVAQGYWNKSAASKATFNAYLSDSCEGPYLRTGDLGFISDGELFITGRIKELIILHGRNIYPQDIESVACAIHPILRPGRGAAFTIGHEEEKLILVHEVERAFKSVNLVEVTQQIREAVVRQCGVRLLDIVYILPNSIPVTSSGKVRRYVCRQAYLDNSLGRCLCGM